MRIVTVITLVNGEKLELPGEKGAAIREAVLTGDSMHIVLSDFNNRVIKKSMIADIDDQKRADLLPPKKPKALDIVRASKDSEGYQKFLEMRNKLINKKSL